MVVEWIKVPISTDGKEFAFVKVCDIAAVSSADEAHWCRLFLRGGETIRAAVSADLVMAAIEEAHERTRARLAAPQGEGGGPCT